MIYLKMPDGKEYDVDEYDGIITFKNKNKLMEGFAKWSDADGKLALGLKDYEGLISKSDDTWG